MASTPEGKVKQAVKKLLKQYEPLIYTHWPVPAGYGDSTLDCIGCIGGVWFAIEAKAPGKKPTDRQDQVIARIQRAGGAVFVIDDALSPKMVELERFLSFHQHGAARRVMVA